MREYSRIILLSSLISRFSSKLGVLGALAFTFPPLWVRSLTFDMIFPSGVFPPKRVSIGRINACDHLHPLGFWLRFGLSQSRTSLLRERERCVSLYTERAAQNERAARNRPRF